MRGFSGPEKNDYTVKVDAQRTRSKRCVIRTGSVLLSLPVGGALAGLCEALRSPFHQAQPGPAQPAITSAGWKPSLEPGEGCGRGPTMLTFHSQRAALVLFSYLLLTLAGAP